MEKKLLLTMAALSLVALVWCNCNCDREEAAKFCLDNWWTYSHVISQDEEYWECFFPSWIGCRDDILWTEECQFEPNLDSIDTEEKRLAGCEENVQWWMTDMVSWAENSVVEWGDESEGWASFVRNWVVRYSREWSNYKMDVECVADFVDGSISVSYSEEELDA